MIRWRVAVLLALFTFPVGCGGSGKSEPKSAPAHGHKEVSDVSIDIDTSVFDVEESISDVVESDLGPCAEPPYEFGCPCIYGYECESGICLNGADGRVCSKECDSEPCPEGWQCLETDPGTGSTIMVCVPVSAPDVVDITEDVESEAVSASSIGQSCSSDADCSEDEVCLTWLPGGYCSIEGCDAGSCPEGSVCVVLQSDSGEETLCLDQCQSDSDCRPGYFCHPEVKVCWYAAGSGSSEIGGPCSDDSDCKDYGAVCYPASFGGEPTGFAEGYCILFDCKQGQCPEGSECFVVTNSGDTACLKVCDSDADCRKGYSCQDGVCWPYCMSDSECPGGYLCAATEQMCVEKSVYCSAENQMGWCPGDLVCIDGECQVYEFECTDTTYEPNDQPSQAAQLEEGEYKVPYKEELQICSNDNDYFTLEIPEGYIGTVGMYFNHKLGDLDLCAYDVFGNLLGCRYPIEDYPSTWRDYDWNDEFLSALSLSGTKTILFKGDGWNGAVNNYDLYVWLTKWIDGENCTDYFPEWDCKGCKPDGTCVKGSFDANLIQFPFPDPNDGFVGDGYILEHSSSYRWLRREVIMAIRYAIWAVEQQFPGTKPLGLLDMCQIDGITPGFDVGKPRHPATTHDEGGNIDVAYYQTVGDNTAKVICDPNGGSNDGYFCTSVENHIVDLPRTAYFLAKIAENPRFRVAGVDKLIGPLILDELDKLYNQGLISAVAYNKLKSGYLAFGDGWPFHHHHIHISFKWWYQRHEEPPIKCGFRMPGDGTWEGYIEHYYKGDKEKALNMLYSYDWVK